MKKAVLILSVCLAVALMGCGVLAYELYSWKKSFSDTFALWQEEYDLRTELEAKLGSEKAASGAGENIAGWMVEDLVLTGKATDEEALIILTKAMLVTTCEMYVNGEIDKDEAAEMLESLDNETTMDPVFVPLMVDLTQVMADLSADNKQAVETAMNEIRETNYLDT